jgi:hypothetical protein
VDFLQPIDRYVTGLTAPTVPDRTGQLVPNPLFIDLDPSDAVSAVRDPSMVFVAGIVGVPWQDIARRNAAGQPDAASGYQTASEMLANGTWDIILGDPSNYVPPQDPLMIESVDPRSGVHPITGEPLAPPGDPTGNGINGSEYLIPLRDALQYACIFDLPAPRDCSVFGALCDCPMVVGDPTDNPLCDPNATHMQIKAKSHPGIRELQVLKGAGSQGIVGSVCPAQLVDTTLASFGYRPAVRSVVEAAKQRLRGNCLPRALTPDAQSQVPCLIVEAQRISDPSQCTAVCSAPGRQPIAQDHPAVLSAKEDPLSAVAQWNCFCEIPQVAGQELAACQNDENDSPTTADGRPVDGWCYIDGDTVPPTGNPALVEMCADTQRRTLRFVGSGAAAPGGTLFVTCSRC